MLGYILFLAGTFGLDVEKESEPALRQELLTRVAKDQEARFATIKLMQQVQGNPLDEKAKSNLEAATKATQAIDTQNRAWLKDLINKGGWPGRSRVGRDGTHAAWLLVQHADSDREFQKKCLELLEKAVAAKEAEAVDLAYLTDRVLVAEGKKQRYGTQLSMKEGKLQPGPVENEEKLDERRKELGMQSMAEYLKMAEAMYLGQKSTPPSDKK